MKQFAKLNREVVKIIKEGDEFSLIEFADGCIHWVDSRHLKPVFIDKLIRFITDMGFTRNGAMTALKIGQYILVCAIGATIGKILYHLFT